MLWKENREVMKKILVVIFLAIILTACTTPTPQVTVTPKTTVTPSPTNTPAPTSPPEPALPAEAVEKFDKAGIDVKNMDNATFDQNGLHITIDEKTVDIPNAELEKFVYQENGVTKEIYQFLPVVDKDTNNMVLYTFNKDTNSWEVKEELPLVKISVDKNKPSSCTYMDVLSGNLARSIREQAIIEFPEDAVNMGWDYKKGEAGTAPIFLVEGSKNAMQLANFCKMPADFLGLDGTIDIATVAVLNPDDSTGLVNFLLGNDKDLRQWIVDTVENGGFNLGLLRRAVGNFSNSLKSVPLIFKVTNGEIINSIQTSDTISEEASRSIFVPAGR